MTQLIIAGTEVALPQQFSVTVKRENPFFTKSGGYTYDCQLRLDNPVNQQLYGFVNRLNRTAQVATGRTAILMADGHVYCRGTEVITKWTNDTVTIQIVSGESELNWLVGQELKVSQLQMDQCDIGWVSYVNQLEVADLSIHHDLNWPTYNCCYPTVRDEGADITYNQYCQNSQLVQDTWTANRMPALKVNDVELRPQPFLCALVQGIIEALDYELGTDELATHEAFSRAFIVNTVDAQSLDETLPGWTVKEFLEEIEKLCGCVFLVSPATDPDKKGRVDILLKKTYFMNARQLPVRNVTDQYEMERISEADGTDQSTATLQWQLPETQTARLACLPEGLRNSVRVVSCNGIAAVKTALQAATVGQRLLALDTTTGCYWIRDKHTFKGYDADITKDEIRIVDYLRPLERANAPGTMEMGIVPALMDWWWWNGSISWGETDSGISFVSPVPVKTIIVNSSVSSTEETDAETFGDLIRETTEPAEPSKAQLYIALFDGLHAQDNYVLLPQPYVDAYQATVEPGYQNPVQGDIASEEFVGSLLLPELDSTAYGTTAYQIDTSHAVTFETFDPNVIDVRQVYVVNNKRYVVRDCEEVITAEGRQPLWRLTCYPITISDEAIANGWILTHGVWDDGAAWLDDGRWIDSPSQ